MASRPLRPGDPRRLGDYQLIARLGEGGMGTVFLGRDPSGRPVAVKAIRREYAEHEEFRARFRSEVNRVRQVPSFCTAAVLDADPDHQTPYLVVEYVDGPSLQEVVTEQGPISTGDLHSVALGVGAALTAIHGAGVVHRDLKPTNVLLSLGLPKVIDFGLAQALEVTSRHTRTDHVVGTVAYLAPERLDPTIGPVSQAADIFAWGGVVAYAGTGRTPFGGDTPMATAARILTMPPELNGLPKPLLDLVTRALTKDPHDRPTANEIVQELLTASTPRARMPAVAAGWKDLAEHDRPAIDQPAPDQPVQEWPGQDQVGQAGHEWAGQERVGQEWPGQDRPERTGPRHGRPDTDELANGRAENGRFDARELLEQLIAEGPKQPPPAPLPAPRRARATAPVSPASAGPSPAAAGRNPGTAGRSPGTAGRSPGTAGRSPAAAGRGAAAGPSSRSPEGRARASRTVLPIGVPKRPLLYGVVALVVAIGALATYAWAADEEPAAAPTPPAATSAAASAVALDGRGPSFFDPLANPRRFQESTGESGSCAFADSQLRVRTTGTSTYMCPSPEDVFAGDQTITVDLTLAAADSCAMVWFRYGGVRGYQLAACADRLEMSKVGGAVVTSIGRAESDALRPGTRHKLSVSIDSRHATVAIDGSTAIQAAASDRGLASGRIVLGVTGARAASPAEVRFADLEVRTG